MTSFWNKLKTINKSNVTSKLKADDLADFYKTTMTDSNKLNFNQEKLSLEVETKATKLSCMCVNGNPAKVKFEDGFILTSAQCNTCGHLGNRVNIREQNTVVNRENVVSIIQKLKRSSTPGCDGITASHLFHALSDPLADALHELYTIIIATSTVPSTFESGIIIPILKKSTLDPNIPSNYRPITISSVHSKIMESMMMPEDTADETQFGFRKGRGTSAAVTLVHDMAKYMSNNATPIYICSLDAEKCFDSIWHQGLFYKLNSKLPDSHWIFLYKWYKSSKAQVYWNREQSKSFIISKGMRQGSILSPHLVSIFINDLLINLRSKDCGVKIQNLKVNTLAYADDINLFSTTSTGLQELIDVCDSYAKTWRIRFNPVKTKCTVIGKSNLKRSPTWKLDGAIIPLSEDITILGVNLSQDMKATAHIKNRVRACNQSVFKFTTAGLSYPGLSCVVKNHIWNTINCPVLTYGLETLQISKTELNELKSTQGSIIKRGLGLSKRSHYHCVLQACNISPIENVIRDNAARLFHNIFQSNTPTKELQSILLAKYLINGTAEKGTLLDRVVKAGYDPLELTIMKPRSNHHHIEDGLVDSLKQLIYHENYQKPWSQEHILATLLTRAF